MSYYDTDGRLVGSYVYLLLCQDGGPIYVKAGISSDPLKRLQGLRSGCPVTPRQFYTMKRPSRRNALRIECALHMAFGPWLVHGEWFKVPAEDKPVFNAAMRSAIAPHTMTGYPAEWTRIAVKPLAQLAASRRQYFRSRWARMGVAFHDFHQHSK